MVEPGRHIFNLRAKELKEVDQHNEEASQRVELLDKRAQKYNPAVKLALFFAEKVFRRDPLGRKKAQLISRTIAETYTQAQSELEKAARNGVLVDLVDLKFETNPDDRGFMATFTYDPQRELRATSGKSESVDLLYSQKVQTPKAFMEEGRITAIYVPVGQTIKHEYLHHSKHFVSKWDLNLTALPRTLTKESVLDSLPKSSAARVILHALSDRRN